MGGGAFRSEGGGGLTRGGFGFGGAEGDREGGRGGRRELGGHGRPKRVWSELGGGEGVSEGCWRGVEDIEGASCVLA